ncbi:hypothetical protein VFPFJ_10424 [Purpureocillium lilacinum]|uniref:SNF2 N-terminal domain-containing protein n=1 Tax=Purpureocillium lilacinum TaxID=33203 RepID=A0A179GGA1_PURLI|nr:hypothetical protein VFPFJ_10424 [Purpureocillium lilacinum]OAQ76887.1 hypothetical protein VFPFJ_10424 [Purpureocillium lilacinum]
MPGDRPPSIAGTAFPTSWSPADLGDEAEPTTRQSVKFDQRGIAEYATFTIQERRRQRDKSANWPPSLLGANAVPVSVPLETLERTQSTLDLHAMMGHSIYMVKRRRRLDGSRRATGLPWTFDVDDEFPLTPYTIAQIIDCYHKQGPVDHGNDETWAAAEDFVEELKFGGRGAALHALMTTLRNGRGASAYANAHPEDFHGIDDLVMQTMKLDMASAATPPPPDVGWEEVCAKYGLDPRHLSLYPNQGVQPLTPHQVADLDILMHRVEAGLSIMLSNDSGLGKTRELYALVVLHTRLLEKKRTYDSTVAFKPSLIISTVPKIEQTAQESTHFPDITLFVYYCDSGPSGSAQNTRHVGNLSSILEKVDPADPKTGRTVILTTYQTLQLTEVSVSESPFVFRQKVQPQACRPQGHDATSEDDADERAVALRYETDQEVLWRCQNTPRVSNPRSESLPRALSGTYPWHSVMFVEAGDVPESDGISTKYSLRNPGLNNHQFEFLIVDEAHVACQLNGAFNNTLRLFNWEKLLWVTGMVLTRSLREILSPTYLMSQKLGFTVSDWHTLGLGDLQLLFHPAYDPTALTNDIDDLRCGGLLHPKSPFMGEIDGHVCKRLWDEHGVRAWMINTYLINEVGEARGWGFQVGANVIRPLLDMLSLRRTFNTPITLPAGKTVYPARQLPPMSVLTEEVAFSKERVPGMRKVVRTQGSVMAESFLSCGGSGSLSLAAHRIGQYVAHDYRALQLIIQQDSCLDVFGPNLEESARFLRQLRAGVATMPSHTHTGERLDNNDESPPVTDPDNLEDIRKLVENAPCGFASYYVNIAKFDFSYPPFMDNAILLESMLSSSPVMARACRLIVRHVLDRNERVLIVVETDFLQELLITVCDDLLSLRVNTCRAKDRAHDTLKQVREFNDPDSGSQVFIANMSMLSTGVNLHTCCHLGITVSFAQNANLMRQVHYLLHRLGQTKPVTWHAIKAIDSFHDHQELHCVAKLASQLAAELDLQTGFGDGIEEVIVFECMRAYYHHSFNRLAWVLLKPSDPTGFRYYADNTIKLGHALSIIAKMAISTEGKEHRAYFLRDIGRYLVQTLTEWVSDKPVEDLYRRSLATGAELWDNEEADKEIAQVLEQVRARCEEDEAEEEARQTHLALQKERTRQRDAFKDPNFGDDWEVEDDFWATEE